MTPGFRYSGLAFSVKADGETPFEAVRLATRAAENMAKDMPVDCEVKFTDAEFKNNYSTFSATLRGDIVEKDA